MNSVEMSKRTKAFALRIIQLVEALPKSRGADVIGRQLLRSGTSVGANYREACRGQSRPDFISKMGVVLKEAEESLYWMELLVDAGLIEEKRLADLMKECNEIISIVVASIKTAKINRKPTS